MHSIHIFKYIYTCVCAFVRVCVCMRVCVGMCIYISHRLCIYISHRLPFSARALACSCRLYRPRSCRMLLRAKCLWIRGESLFRTFKCACAISARFQRGKGECRERESLSLLLPPSLLQSIPPSPSPSMSYAAQHRSFEEEQNSPCLSISLFLFSLPLSLTQPPPTRQNHNTHTTWTYLQGHIPCNHRVHKWAYQESTRPPTPLFHFLGDFLLKKNGARYNSVWHFLFPLAFAFFLYCWK
jgi:hypothetical protein